MLHQKEVIIRLLLNSLLTLLLLVSGDLNAWIIKQPKSLKHCEEFHLALVYQYDDWHTIDSYQFTLVAMCSCFWN